MGTEEQTRQLNNVLPPRVQKIWVQAVDATSRAYDLTALNLGDVYNAPHSIYVYLTMRAEGGDVYFGFDSVNTDTIDDTAAITAGTTPSSTNFTTTSCWVIPNGQTVRMRILRNVDKYLYLKTSTGTAKCRIYASSHPSTSAVSVA